MLLLVTTWCHLSACVSTYYNQRHIERSKSIDFFSVRHRDLHMVCAMRIHVSGDDKLPSTMCVISILPS